MGLDMVRAGGGRVPLLMALLSLLSLGLIFNWWSLSTENLELLRQVDSVGGHLKSSSSLLDQCRRDRTSFESRVQTLEDHTDELVKSLTAEKQKSSNLEKSVKKQASDISDLEKKSNGAIDSLHMCQAELESLKKVDVSKDGVIASMRIEKGDLNNQIQELKEQVTKLQNEIEEMKTVPKAIPPPSGNQENNKSSTAASPPKPQNAVLPENEPRNIPEPNHADTKEDHAGEKEDPQLTDDRDVDQRELEQQEAAEDKREA